MKVKNDHRSKFPIVSNWKEAWKNQGFNGIRARDLCDTGAMLYQPSYEATHWEREAKHKHRIYVSYILWSRWLVLTFTLINLTYLLDERRLELRSCHWSPFLLGDQKRDLACEVLEIKFCQKMAGFNKKRKPWIKVKRQFTFWICDLLFSSFFSPSNKKETDLKSWLLRSKNYTYNN